MSHNAWLYGKDAQHYHTVPAPTFGLRSIIHINIDNSGALRGLVCCITNSHVRSGE